MMQRLLGARSAVLRRARPLVTSATPPRRSSMDGAGADYQGVLGALAHYFDALHHKDPGRMAEVWHERCTARRPSGDGGVTCIDAPTFLQIVGTTSCQEDGASQTDWQADRVVNIDFAGPVTAKAKVEVTLNPSTYTDHLALLRLADGWKIVAKLFTNRVDQPCERGHHAAETVVAEVGAAVASYFAARRNADSRLMGAILHPSCQLFGARRDNGALCEVERELFVGRSSGAHAPTPAASALPSGTGL